MPSSLPRFDTNIHPYNQPYLTKRDLGLQDQRSKPQSKHAIMQVVVVGYYFV